MPAAQSEQRALFIDVSYCLELFVFHIEVILEFLFLKFKFTRAYSYITIVITIYAHCATSEHLVLCQNLYDIHFWINICFFHCLFYFKKRI